MYMFLSSFNYTNLKSMQIRYFGKSIDNTKFSFSEAYEKISSETIERCICYFAGKANDEHHAYELKINKVVKDETSIVFNYSEYKELPEKSGNIRKALYHFSCKYDWLKEHKGFINIFPLDGVTYKEVMNFGVNKNKAKSHLLWIREEKAKNNWLAICDKYESLEKITKTDLWDVPDILYEIGFAASKLAEPDNKLKHMKWKEKEEHLKKIKRYGEINKMLYERCYNLDSKNYLYAYSLGYYWYKNSLNPENRKKGKEFILEACNNGLKYLDKALELYPNHIRSLYNKLQLKQFQLKLGNNSHDERAQKEIFDIIKKIEEVYADSNPESQQRNRQKYLKARYQGIKVLLNNIRLKDFYKEIFLEQAFAIRPAADFLLNIHNEVNLIVKCKKMLEETRKEIFTDSNLPNDNKKDDVSPSSFPYREGLLYMYMFYLKKYFGLGKLEPSKYLAQATTAFQLAIKLKNRRNDTYIKDKLAICHIANGKPNEAAKILIGCRDAFAVNTRAVALILDKQYDEADKLLASVENDPKNMAKEYSSLYRLGIFIKTHDKNKYKLYKLKCSTMSKAIQQKIEKIEQVGV